MTDWDDAADDFEPEKPGFKVEQPKNNWDDEDVEEDNVKDSWEDEEEPAQTAKSEPKVEKAGSKATSKAPAKKGKQAESTSSEAPIEVLVDPVAEKFRQQRLVEEADLKASMELFGKKNDERSLDTFIPKTEEDFAEYATLIANKLRAYEKSFHYVGLLKTVMRFSMTTLKAADAKEISSAVSVIANEKIKAEKEANAGKKKQGAKKKQLHVEKKDDDDYAPGGYEDPDDYDFM